MAKSKSTSKPKIDIHSLALKDPLAFGITYVDLLEGRQWELDTRQWAKEIYQAVNPYVIEKYPVGEARKLVLMKPTQVGMSTLGIVKMLHFAYFWPVRVMYSLPRQQDVLDFVTTRLDVMLKNNPAFRRILGTPNSTRAKKFGHSYLFFLEASVEPRSMPADALYVDEIDLSDQDNIGTMQNRLDASQWKLEYFFSTPTISGFGIHALYENSDKREWFVKCPHCGHQQIMEWETNLRVKGPQNNPHKVSYVCAKCGKELTLYDIQNGSWVPAHPERSHEVIGYHISQMMVKSAAELWSLWRHPSTTVAEFYRKRLGKPYEISGGSLTRDAVLTNCFDDPQEFEPMSDGSSQYFLGADQGNEIQVLVAKLVQGQKRPRLVHIEIIPFDKGFDRVGELLRTYNVKRAVVDADPNRHPVAKLQRAFPGRVIMADYANIKQRFQKKDGKIGGVKTTTNVVINRTQGFDDLMESINNGWWILPGNPASLPPDVELLVDHLTALKRDIRETNTATGKVQTAVWRKLRPDHLAHAMLYLKTAIEMTSQAAFRVRVIGVKKQNPSNENESLNLDDDIPQEHIEQVRYYLAEVPEEQLTEYYTANGAVEDPPFPLNHKLKFIKDLPIESILAGIHSLLF